MKINLGTQVATAVGGMLVGRSEITLDEIVELLPHALREARPSHKAMTRALVHAGWSGVTRLGGAVVYRAPDAGPDADDEGQAGIGNNVAVEEVRTLLERIERLREERKGITDDIRDVLAEAKGRGHDPKALTRLIAIRAKKKEEWHEEQAILEVYMRSMGMM